MILDSLGLGELGIVVVLIVVLVEPKRFGQILRSIANFRGKMGQIQNQVRTQINSLVLEDELRLEKEDLKAQQQRLRDWGKTQVAQMPAQQRQEASNAICESVLAWPQWQDAESISVFIGRHDEVDTENIIRQALSQEKKVFVPYVLEEEGETSTANPPSQKSFMGFCRIQNFDHDLTEGRFRILEPRSALRPTPPESFANPSEQTSAARKADLTLIPGLCFDASGGRIGHGKGYYDRHLAQCDTFKLGIAFEGQLSRNKLPLHPHDQPLEGLVTESRFLVFAEPRRPNNPARGGMETGS